MPHRLGGLGHLASAAVTSRLAPMQSGVKGVTERPAWPPYPKCPNCNRRLNGNYLDDSGQCPRCRETFGLTEWQSLDHGYWAVQQGGRMIIVGSETVMQAVSALFRWMTISQSRAHSRRTGAVAGWPYD